MWSIRELNGAMVSSVVNSQSAPSWAHSCATFSQCLRHRSELLRRDKVDGPAYHREFRSPIRKCQTKIEIKFVLIPEAPFDPARVGLDVQDIRPRQIP